MNPATLFLSTISFHWFRKGKGHDANAPIEHLFLIESSPYNHIAKINVRLS